MKLDKAAKELGDEYVNELSAMDVEQLDKRIVQANEAMQEADDELDENQRYQSLKEDLKALTAGRRAVHKRQKAVITVAVHLKGEGRGQQ